MYFNFSCGVHVVGSLLYLIKGSGEVQEWAKVTTKDTEKKDIEGKTNRGYYRSFDEVELEAPQ